MKGIFSLTVCKGVSFSRFLLIAGFFLGALLPAAKSAPYGASPSHVKADLLVDTRPRDGAFLAAVRLRMEKGWHIYWENPGSPGLPPQLKWTLPPNYEFGPIEFPAPHRFEAAGFKSYGYEDEAILLVTITPPAGAGLPEQISVDGKWLVCADQCVQERASLTWKTGGPSDPKLFDTAIAALPERVDWPVAGTYDSAKKEITFTISDGGAAAGDPAKFYFYPNVKNVTDSAAPEIVTRSGNSLQVVTAAEPKFAGSMPKEIGGVLVGDGGKAWRMGGPIAIGAAAIPSPAASKQGWGYWLQRPLIVVLLAVVMLLIALNLFGVFEVGGSLTGAGADLTHKEGLAGSFFSGALATLLATPCTAPAMGFAITYALGAPVALAVLIFTLIGLGMSTPYLLLSAFPAWISKLPRPGAWMETFKQSMAFPMLLVMGWLVTVMAQQVNGDGLFFAACALVLVAFAAWIYGRFGSLARELPTRQIAWASTAILMLSAYQFAAKGAGMARPVVSRDVEAEIATLQKSGKSVFVDFTASWCVTCQANKPALHGEEIQKAFEANNVAFLEVDWTQEDPAILHVLQKYGRSGVPLYLLFPKDPARKPKELPNLLTKDTILEAVRGGDQKAVVGAPAPELGLWAALGGAFLGGMILNLMPCVFPVITLKIMGFVAQAGEDRKRILHHGLAFTAGVLVFFWIITAVLLSARAALAV